MIVSGCLAIGLVVADISNLPSKLLRNFRGSRKKPAQTSEIVAALESDFDYLKFEEGCVMQYVHAYKERYRDSVFLPLDNEIKEVLILSTDFIQNQGDELRVVRFVALYSPYDTPCYNPHRMVNRNIS